MKKIASKNTSKAKRKLNVYKCDYCIRKFVSITAFQTHNRVEHSFQANRYKGKQYVNPTKKVAVNDNVVQNVQVKNKTVKTPVIESTMSTRRTSNAPTSIAAPFKAQNMEKKETPSSKEEFECPRCFLSFNTYLIAAQHIQKFHYANKNVPVYIQPERKEMCLKCNRKVKSIPTHVCGVTKLVEQDCIYHCLECNKRLSNLRLFYAHVVSSHSVNVETLFFPTYNEFTKWAQDLEYQTNGRYSQFVKMDTKCYAHCLRACRKGTNVINVCPSLIMIHEFPKGLQVHYYGKHCQHPYKKYKFTGIFKKYSITSYLKSSDSYFQMKDLKSDDNDLYLQFKQLMENVVIDAAKLKKETLTVLFGKALELTSVLTSYDYDDDMSDDSEKTRSMTESDIERALEDPSILDDTSKEPDRKKVKIDLIAPSPMIVNSFSLAPADATKEDKTPNKAEQPIIKVKEIGSLQDPKVSNDNKETPKRREEKIDKTTPSSFNESFAVFLEKNFSLEKEDLHKRSTRSSRPIRFMKTRIGQYKPPSPQKLRTGTAQVNKGGLTDKPVQESPKPAAPLQPLAQLPKGRNSSLPSTQIRLRSNSGASEDIQKEKALRNISVEIEKTTKVNNLPNQKNIPVKSKGVVDERTKPVAAIKTTRELNPKPKKDIKYEVKEQKDDCNILILKI